MCFRSSPASQREALLEIMWSVWPDLPLYGSKAVQFVDLLGYFTIKTPQTSERKVLPAYRCIQIYIALWSCIFTGGYWAVMIDRWET